jgi:hypothetical protein
MEQLSSLKTGLGTAAETRDGTGKDPSETGDENQIKK